MAPSSFVLEMLPGDCSSVVYAGTKIVDLRSNTYCKVTVELIPFDSYWSSVDQCKLELDEDTKVLDFSKTCTRKSCDDKQAFEAPFPPESTIPLSHSSF